MMDKKIYENFDNGMIACLGKDKKAESIDWIEHSVFQGVFLKHLIKGEETDGSISCHLVKVNPGCILDTHVHNGKIEIHNVLEGIGECFFGDRTIPYKQGSVSLIPADTTHKVIAGIEGLFILATFTPALL